ncbi:MAG TPA: helix-turn-helix domain-containing protein, partial [Vicinamibacterales bacterium]
QIANATKIGMSALEALERNDISRLPGGIFSRAFVRSYAVEVGLDPEATIQEFIAQFPHETVTAGHPTSTQSEDHQAIDSDRRAATTFVRLIAVSIPIASAMLYFGTAGRRAAPQAPDPPPAVTTAARVATPAAPVETLPAPIDAPPAAAPAGAAPAAPAAAVKPASAATVPSDRLTVALSAIGECWVSATVDGEKRVERLLQPGERLAMEVRRELVLTAGDASALAITLNGEAARPLGRPGEVVTARLNLANFKDYVASR